MLVVLRALKLGDFLTGIPALRALARAFPDHHRILAAPARFGELVAHTGMHEVADTPDLGPLDERLHHPDVAVDLHGRGPESQSVLQDAAAGRLISFRSAATEPTAGHPVWRPDEHEVARWCRLLQESGIAADPTDIRLGDLPDPPRADAHGATIIHPGAASAARRWPADRFAAVARWEAEAGRTVLVTGAGDERPLAETVARQAGLPPSAVVAGTTTLESLAALIAAAGRVISGDTGVAHMATATGTPSVVLFGPIPPAEWGPPPTARHIALWAGRRGDPHGAVVDPGLLRISVPQVLAALNQLPEPTPDRRPDGRRAAAGAAQPRSPLTPPRGA